MSSYTFELLFQGDFYLRYCLWQQMNSLEIGEFALLNNASYPSAKKLSNLILIFNAQ